MSDLSEISDALVSEFEAKIARRNYARAQFNLHEMPEGLRLLVNRYGDYKAVKNALLDGFYKPEEVAGVLDFLSNLQKEILSLWER